MRLRSESLNILTRQAKKEPPRREKRKSAASGASLGTQISGPFYGAKGNDIDARQILGHCHCGLWSEAQCIGSHGLVRLLVLMPKPVSSSLSTIERVWALLPHWRLSDLFSMLSI